MQAQFLISKRRSIISETKPNTKPVINPKTETKPYSNSENETKTDFLFEKKKKPKPTPKLKLIPKPKPKPGKKKNLHLATFIPSTRSMKSSNGYPMSLTL
jgi:hypothetical protein